MVALDDLARGDLPDKMTCPYWVLVYLWDPPEHPFDSLGRSVHWSCFFPPSRPIDDKSGIKQMIFLGTCPEQIVAGAHVATSIKNPQDDQKGKNVVYWLVVLLVLFLLS
jgi:hypothetical protein